MKSFSRTFAPHLLATAVVFTAMLPSHASVAGILGTKEQHDKEELALRLLASKPMQEQIKVLQGLYRKEPFAQTPSGQKTLMSAATSMAMGAAEWIAIDDPDRPMVMWDSNAQHKWMGLDVPRSGMVQDNPDNVYRNISIDGAAKYEITGKVTKPGPSQETFVVYGQIPGLPGSMQDGHMKELSGLRDDQIQYGPDGSFTITVDSDPANGRPNHIQSQADKHHELILVRDSLSDWATQNLVDLKVRRVDGPPLQPVPSEKDLADRAATVLAAIGPFWMDWENKFIFVNPVNNFGTPWARKSGWGYTAFSHFDLADDEAIVLTVDAVGAQYLALQLADLWGPALEYRSRNGSMNNAQTKPNVDGTYTYVISVKDPGVYNWADPSGLNAGTFQLRWQAMPAGASAEKAVLSVKVVKLQDLKAALPAGTVFVTPAERKAQLNARLASYMRREND